MCQDFRILLSQCYAQMKIFFPGLIFAQYKSINIIIIIKYDILPLLHKLSQFDSASFLLPCHPSQQGLLQRLGGSSISLCFESHKPFQNLSNLFTSILGSLLQLLLKFIEMFILFVQLRLFTFILIFKKGSIFINFRNLPVLQIQL